MWQLSSYIISLLSVTGKVYTKVLQQRLKRYVEEEMSEEQAGFRKGKGTMEQIFVIRQLSEKYTEMNRTLNNNFIDFKQAFDSVWQKGLWSIMKHCGVPEVVGRPGVPKQTKESARRYVIYCVGLGHMF